MGRRSDRCLLQQGLLSTRGGSVHGTEISHRGERGEKKGTPGCRWVVDLHTPLVEVLHKGACRQPRERLGEAPAGERDHKKGRLPRSATGRRCGPG